MNALNLSRPATIDFPDIDIIETLRGHVGDAECMRLGFMVDDELGVQTLSAAGFGYLVFAQACAGASAAETFAAGYQCAAQIHCEANDLRAELHPLKSAT